MRAILIGLACAVATVGCTTKDKCKSNTALVTASFDAAAAGADELDVVVQLDQQASMTATLPGPGGRSSGTMEVQFPHGYHAGAALQVSVTARLAGADVASGHASTTLAAGCSSLSIVVNANGGGDNDLGAPGDMTTLPVPSVNAKPDLVGFTTSLDGSGSTDPLGSSLTYAWSVDKAPTGSAITTASLTSTTATKTAFDPDLGGSYKISLTVTTDDGRSATKVSDITVPTVPIFYTRAVQTTLTNTLGAHVIASDGTGDHAIGCEITGDGGVDRNTEPDLPFFGHAYEPPVGGTVPPLYAFLNFMDTSTPPQVVVGSASTNCTSSPPTRVDNNVFNDHIAVSARFSPDGKRIVYVDMPQDESQGTYRLVTVAVDGVGPKHVVRSDGFYGFTPAIWLDNSTVAWVERDTSSFTPFSIFSAPDANAAGDPASNMRTQILRCDPATTSTHLGEINQFEKGPFGFIVAASTSPRGALDPPPLSAVNLYKLAANDCSTTTAKVLAAEPKGGLSWDFSLSPDGLSILFSSTHNQAVPDGGAPEPQTDIFLVPSDGSAAAQKIAGDPLYDDINPRWVAGGRQFVWSRAPRHLDMGADVPAVLIANADGTHVHAFVPPTASGETLVRTDLGANRGFDCSWTPGAASPTGAAALVGALALVLLGLRRRRGR